MPGRANVGPDIVAIDPRTGRPIVVEAKGQHGRPRTLGRYRLRSQADGNETVQTSRPWLESNSERYMRDLRT